jgi:hypothetical protein
MRICIHTTGTCEKIERDRPEYPAVEQRVADDPGEQRAGDRLHHDGRGREQEVGDDDDARHAGDDRRIARAMCQQHEEGDAGPGAEQHSGADEVEEFQGEVRRHQRSSKVASAKAMSIAIGAIRLVARSSLHGDGRQQPFLRQMPSEKAATPALRGRRLTGQPRRRCVRTGCGPHNPKDSA